MTIPKVLGEDDTVEFALKRVVVPSLSTNGPTTDFGLSRMPDHLPKVNAFRNLADDFQPLVVRFGAPWMAVPSLRKLLYASGGPAVQRI